MATDNFGGSESLRLVVTATAQNPNVGDLYLDEDGQLDWLGGDISDQESYARMVSQRVRSRIMLIRGEWYLDQREGTPWIESILVKGVTVERVRRVITDVVTGTPGVQSLVGMDISIDNTTRAATIERLEIVAEMNQVVTVAALDRPIIVEIPNG
jgi:hypothetical protein